METVTKLMSRISPFCFRLDCLFRLIDLILFGCFSMDDLILGPVVSFPELLCVLRVRTKHCTPRFPPFGSIFRLAPTFVLDLGSGDQPVDGRTPNSAAQCQRPYRGDAPERQFREVQL